MIRVEEVERLLASGKRLTWVDGHEHLYNYGPTLLWILRALRAWRQFTSRLDAGDYPIDQTEVALIGVVDELEGVHR